MNVVQTTRNPFYQSKLFFIIVGILLLTILGKMYNSKSTNKDAVAKPAVMRSQMLKEIVTYTEHPYSKSGYESITTYYYGLYIALPKDTTGIANEVMEFLEEKAKKAKHGEAIHLWIFSDSTVIPKSFSAEWSTSKNRKKCFGHAVKLSNGNYIYDYDIFGEFNP